MATAIFLRSDTTTQGSWVGVYGADGYNICGYGSPSYPAYLKLTPGNNNPYTNTASTASVRGLQKYDTPTDRFIGGWYGPNNTGQPLTLDFLFTGDHQLAMYFNDFDNGSRSQTVVLTDGDTGVTLDSRNLGLPVGFWSPPLWLIYRVNGHVRVVITTLGSATTLLNGFFFDPVNTGTVSSIDGILGTVTLSGTDVIVSDNTPAANNIQFSLPSLIPNPAGTVLADTFTDANGVDLLAHTMNAGPGWTRVDAGAVIQIQGNQAQVMTLDGASNRASYVCQRGLTDCSTYATVLIPGTGEAGLIYRYIDPTHFWAVTGYTGDGKIYVYLANGAAPTQYTSFSAGVQAGVPFLLRVDTSGNVHRFYRGGTLAGSFTDATNNTGTQYGLRSWQVNNTWENFNSPAQFANATVTVNSRGRVTAVSPGLASPPSLARKWYPLGNPFVLNLANINANYNGFRGGFASHGWCYCVPANNADLVRVNIDDFATVQAIDLSTVNANYTKFGGGFTDGRYGYLLPSGKTNSGLIVRVDLQSFTTANVNTLNLNGISANLKAMRGCCMDGVNGYGQDASGDLLRFSLSNFTPAGCTLINLTSLLGTTLGPGGLETDGKNLYALWTSAPNVFITCTPLNNFSAAASTIVNLSAYGTGAATIQMVRDYLYYSITNTTVTPNVHRVVKIAKDFSQQYVLNVGATNANFTTFYGCFNDAQGRYLYMGPSGNQAWAARVDLSNFQTVEAVSLSPFGVGSSNGSWGDGRYGFHIDPSGPLSRFQLFYGGHY